MNNDVTEPINTVSATDFPTTEIRYYIEAPINTEYADKPENDFVNEKTAKTVLVVTLGLMLFIVGIALLSDLW